MLTSLTTGRAVAAKYLARKECGTALICGCGGQAASQLAALRQVRAPRRVLTYDQDRARAAAFASAIGGTPATDLAGAASESDIIITCTTARRYFITREMVRPGTFIAAVGADNESKQEIDPHLMAQAKVVTDVTEQASRIGDLHHVIDAGMMTREAVHA